MARSKSIAFESAFAWYTSRELMGQGGASRVLLAEDGSGAPFAVNVLDAAKASGDRLKRFKREYEFCRRTEHPNIVQALDNTFGEIPCRPA